MPDGSLGSYADFTSLYCREKVTAKRNQISQGSCIQELVIVSLVDLIMCNAKNGKNVEYGVTNLL